MNPHECAAVKCCTKCGESKPISLFNKSVWCKACVSAYDKEIYQRKRNIILEQKREYRANNKEKVSKANKEWQLANAEKLAEYQKQYREAKAKEIADKKREYYLSNRQRILEEKHKYHAKNRDVLLAKRQEYYNNPENYAKFAVQREKRRLTQKQATPKWADINAMRRIYAECKRISQRTGIKHHVDHIIPLHGKLVTGLHVQDNLRIVTASENHRKYNHLIEDIV